MARIPPTYLKVEITDDDIRYGQPCDAMLCPVARAISRAYAPSRVSMMTQVARVQFGIGGIESDYIVPDMLQTMVKTYDSIRYPEDVPDEPINMRPGRFILVHEWHDDNVVTDEDRAWCAAEVIGTV